MEPSFEKRVLFSAKVILAAAALAALVIFGARMFLLVFAGLLFAVFLRSLSDPLARHVGIGPRWSLLLVGMLLVALILGAGWIAAPRIAEQLDALSQRLPEAVERLQQQIESYAWGRALMEQAGSGGVLPQPQPLLKGAGGAFSIVLGMLANLVIILFIGLYVAAEPSTYRKGLLQLVPPNRRSRIGGLVAELHETLKWWLLGKLISMSVIGIFTAIGLWLLDVPLALILGLIAALLTFVPNIGPILSAIPAVLLAWTLGPQKALHVIALYIGVQAVESYVITPLVQRKTISLPPALTLGMQVLLGTLLGIMGLALATPLTAAGMVVVRRLYIEDALEAGKGDDSSDSGSGSK